MTDANDARSSAVAAQSARNLGDFGAAVRHQEAAVAAYRATNEPDRLAHAVRHLGDILIEAGQPDAAVPYVAEMLAMYRALPDAPALDVANAIRSAAVHAETIGNLIDARNLWTEARSRYAELHDQLGEGARNPGVAEAEARLRILDE